jgi:hypothetical protein
MTNYPFKFVHNLYCFPEAWVKFPGLAVCHLEPIHQELLKLEFPKIINSKKETSLICSKITA